MARVRHQVGIAGDVHDIYRALHEPAGLQGWWASSVDGNAAEGQILDLHFTGLGTLSFRVDGLEDAARVALTCVSGPGPWKDSSLRFTCRPDDDQVWVDLTHENAAAGDDDFLYFSTKWACYLLSLKDLIETGRGRPYPDDVKIHIGD